jgi:phosphotriesterase-related protein
MCGGMGVTIEEMAGKALTVLGAIDPDTLGMTSSHEHILAEMSAYFVEPDGAVQRGMSRRTLSPENAPWARAHRFGILDNTRLDDRELACQELLHFKRAGGTTVVDISPKGMCRDPEGLVYVSRATGVNIVMGSSYYLDVSHPADMDDRTEDEIVDEIIGEIVNGVAGGGIRPGLIGEIGCSSPPSQNELKILRASAAAQRRTGAPMAVHPSFSDQLVLEIVDYLRDAGAVLEHTMICHMDSFGFRQETQVAILEAGCYIGYDNFGNLGYPHLYLGKIIDFPTDTQRIRDIEKLIDSGFVDRILVGQDVCFKDMLKQYGGYGYSHLLENVAPLMVAMGLADFEVEALLVKNPRQFLTFRETLE